MDSFSSAFKMAPDVGYLDTPYAFYGLFVGDVMSNKNAIDLIIKWMEDTTGYDERVWPIIKEAIEDDQTHAPIVEDG
jgi:hypothetical protein